MKMSHFVSHSLIFFLSLCLKILGCKMLETSIVMGMVEPLFSQGRLMIGRVSGWSVFLHKVQAFMVQRGDEDRVI